MGKNYDISQTILADAEDKPTITIDTEHEYEINADLMSVLKIKALIDKLEQNPDADTFGEIITIALGKEAFKYIQSLKLRMSSYEKIVSVIVAASQNVDLQTEEQGDGEKK